MATAVCAAEIVFTGARYPGLYIAIGIVTCAVFVRQSRLLCKRVFVLARDLVETRLGSPLDLAEKIMLPTRYVTVCVDGATVIARALDCRAVQNDRSSTWLERFWLGSL